MVEPSPSVPGGADSNGAHQGIRPDHARFLWGRGFLGKPGRDLNRELARGEVAAGEAAEKELIQFISRRHHERLKSEPERATEAVWVEGERRAAAERRRVNREHWRAWHEHRAQPFASLSREHETRARLLGGDAA